MHERVAVLLLLAALWSPAAQAQWSGSVAAVSDYRYRGVDYSAGRAAAQASIAYDAEDGYYAGAFVSNVGFRYGGQARAEFRTYAGQARRLASGTSLDAGVSSVAMSGAGALNYREIYLGLAAERLSGRVSYSPDYLGLRKRTLYLEVRHGLALGARLELVGHLGYLGSLPDAAGDAAIRRVDGHIGLATSVAGWQCQLAWDGLRSLRREPATRYGGPRRSMLVLGVARPF